jgi:SAM-dependent methyltransferase
MTEIHAAAQQGFSSGAQTYARGRPGYPPDILPWLIGEFGITANMTVVDLGAGTGKFTKLLVQAGAKVVAVEPVDEMRAQLAVSLPDLRVLAGTAETIPLDADSVDALLCAQAFHWFATKAALREIHRVLRPGGRLGLVWNVRDESVDWVAAITGIIMPYEGDAPRFHNGNWRMSFTGQYFTPLERTAFVYQHVGTPQQVILDRFLSVSFIAALPEQERANVAGQLRTLIESHPALRQKKTIIFPYRTEAFWCRRID